MLLKEIEIALSRTHLCPEGWTFYAWSIAIATDSHRSKCVNDNVMFCVRGLVQLRALPNQLWSVHTWGKLFCSVVSNSSGRRLLRYFIFSGNLKEADLYQVFVTFAQVAVWQVFGDRLLFGRLQICITNKFQNNFQNFISYRPIFISYVWIKHFQDVRNFLTSRLEAITASILKQVIAEIRKCFTSNMDVDYAMWARPLLAEYTYCRPSVYSFQNRGV